MKIARFVTVHAGATKPPTWVAAIDEADNVYVWVPRFKRFCLSDALTLDLGWKQETILVSLSRGEAETLCRDGNITRPYDKETSWLFDELAGTPYLGFRDVFHTPL